MPMSWNEQTDAKLLVAILHTTNAKLDYPALAEYMGPECTEVAVKLRIQRLRRQVNEANDSHGAFAGAVSEPASSVPASPEKRKKGRKPGSGKAKEAKESKNGMRDSAPASKKVKKEGIKAEEDAEAAVEDA